MANKSVNSLEDFRNIKLKDIMQTEVITIEEESPAPNAAKIMMDNKIHGLCVTSPGNQKELKNIVTSFDLLKVTYLAKLVDETGIFKNIPVKEVLRDQTLVTFAPSDTVGDALKVIAGNNIRTLPVIDAGRLVGVVSIMDILRLLL